MLLAGLYFGLVPALLLRPISRSLYYSLSHAIVGACPQSLTLCVACTLTLAHSSALQPPGALSACSSPSA